MRLKITLASILVPCVVFGTAVIFPPLTDETILGTWEGLLCSPGSPPAPAVFYHMELNKNGESFLAQTSVHGDSSCVVRRLVSSEVKDGKVTLHFSSASVKELRGVTLPELWIIGSGSGIKEMGAITARITDDPSREGENNTRFDKGTWTRDVGEASKKAEEEIRKAASKP